MKNLSNTEAELKKSTAYKKKACTVTTYNSPPLKKLANFSKIFLIENLCFRLGGYKGIDGPYLRTVLRITLIIAFNFQRMNNHAGVLLLVK